MATKNTPAPEYPSDAQFAFLASVEKRGIERQPGRETDGGASWGTQQACEKRGWVGTREGSVRTWERYYTLTEAGEAMLAKARVVKAAERLVRGGK